MSKSKKGSKTNASSKANNDDDWELILKQESEKNSLELGVQQTASTVSAETQQVVTDPVVEKDDDDDEEDDDNNAEDNGEAKKDKKKKKKKSKKDDKKAPPAAAMTATGKAILLRQQQLAAEQERVKQLQEEEERRIREEEERYEAERKAIEDEKERKRKAKANKIETQKASGTYMTKAEKERHKKAVARLESMKAAGMVPAILSTSNTKSNDVKPPEPPHNDDIHVKKDSQGDDSASSSDDEDETATEQLPEGNDKNKVEDDGVADEWDAEGDGDSWLDLAVGNIAAKAEQLTLQNNAEEDTLLADRRQEQERLRILGIERAKRDEELRIRREEEEKERAEMEKKEREAAQRKDQSRKRRMQRDADAKAARSPTDLRSAISCIMGHVDTGKTKLLDKIRHTNVQEGEAGGITQQIGATQFSKETLITQTQCLQRDMPFEVKLPGLLVIDTPGHESFTNLRSRGSSLCDIAILVIDLMHGLEQQTIESINLLKKRKTPFVVALNKVDRCYGWKSEPNSPIREALARQDENTADHIKVQLMELSLNSCLYWDNDDLGHTVSLVPTSAITGEGVPDLLRMVITLTQERMQEKLMYTEALQCTVLEVKVLDGLGHTLDVVLVNGRLREGDTIVISTLEGPVVSSIRALLTPPPNREMRVKSEYIHHQEIRGAIGVKIVGQDLSRAIAGTALLVKQEEDDLDDVMEDVQSDVSAVMKALGTDSQGVYVQASTLGALEALLQFLREDCKPSIPVGYAGIGPIHKKDIMRANIMNEKGKPEFATILAFDIRIDADAQTMADECNVRIFTADIIYHLFDQFTAYMNGIQENRRAEAESIVVFPCILKIMPQHIFNKKDPIVMGVEVLEGTLKLGTMLTVPSIGFLDVGRVTSIENNHKEVTFARKGASVAIKIVNESNPTMTYGRQFDHTSSLYSKISRQSIDALKNFFKDDVSKEDWQLIIKMKKVFNIS
eukprot:gene3215-6358_t